MKKRITDRKAKKIFAEKNIQVTISDLYVKDHRIHYAITGIDSLPTLLFIHGSPGSWSRYINYMNDKELLRKFRMVSIDRPGFGYSNFGKALPLADQCILIQAVLHKIKNNKSVFLFGHSYSGAVVCKLAADNSNMISGIVIVSGAIDPAREKREMWREILNIKPLYYFIPGAYRASNTELLLFKDDLLLLAKALHKITCNVKFVHGEKDKTVPVENISYGKKMMINARPIEVNILNTGEHLLPMTKRSQIKKILLQLN